MFSPKNKIFAIYYIMLAQGIYLSLIQNPFVPKYYRDLLEYYKSINREDIVESLKYFLEVKFADSANSDTTQSPTPK